MDSAIVLSPCQTYRYALWRTWDNTMPWVMFVGLNPSTADEFHNDPTARRCIGFARDWGYGGVCITNVFAYRSTTPRRLRWVDDPIGLENDRWLANLSQEANLVVAAWGNHGTLAQRDKAVLPLLNTLHYLSLTKRGQPAHPLYLRKELTPILWQHDMQQTNQGLE
ncbi:MAG TPA: DUF1643 domain-containing protein [Elainellaceae cyanobacterium]